MKIIQAVGWYYPQSIGGTEIYVAGLCKRLQASGHTVLIAAPDPTALSEQNYLHDGLSVYRYPIPPEGTRAEAQEFSPTRGIERFHSWLTTRQPDVVHFHTFVRGLGVNEVKAAKAAGARVVVTTHSGSLGYICQRGTMMRWGKQVCDGVCEQVKCASCELQRRGMPQWLASTIGRIPTASSQLLFSIPGKMGTALGMSHLIAHNQVKQREMLDSVDKFVVLTEWALQAALSNDLPAEKFSLNRLGLSQDIVFRKPSPEHKPTGQPVKVGYLGRFEHVKGVVELARSIASLGRDVPVEVEFRGPVKSGPEQGIVNEIKRIVGDDPRVTFAPPVSAVEVLDVLAAYDVLCCPSVCLEGGPTVAIEAHAVGTPVIGSRIGGLAELVTDGVNGKLVEPGDWQALASLITEIATDPAGTIDSWRRFLPSARTMDEITADYLSLYSSLKPATSLR